MPSHIKLSQEQCEDLRQLLSLTEEQMEGSIRECDNPKLFSVTELRKALSTVLTSEVTLDAVTRVVTALCTISQRSNELPDQTLGSLRSGLARSVWGMNLIEVFDQRRGRLAQLLSTLAIVRASSSLSLQYEYSDLFQSARILTDVRPLFSKEADEIQAVATAYTLRLRYDNTDGTHSLSVVMDLDDIRALQDQCARALKKAETTSRYFSETGLPVIGHES